MQILSLESNLHEMSKSIFWEKCKKKYHQTIVSAELEQRVINVKLA